MKNKICGNCSQYRQHYVLDENGLSIVYCGHCVQKGAKRKNPDAAACENYSPAPSSKRAFVTKAYLSKALLQYVLRLDLLPKIKEEFEKLK